MTTTHPLHEQRTRNLHLPAGAQRPAAITAAHVVTSYGELDVLRDVSLTVSVGEVFGLIGPNGAGKTTLVESLVGLRTPDAGSIDVLGMCPVQNRERFTTRVAVQPQEATLFENVRVREALELFASFYPQPYSVNEVMEQIGLAELSRHLVRKLSGGQRRRLLLGVALIGAPELIVLDEPSAGLDPQARRALWDVVRQLRASGTTVLLTTHHMDEAAELCDRVAFMIDGRIEDIGTPKELVSRRVGPQTVRFQTSGASVAEVRERMSGCEFVSTVDIRPEPDRAEVRVTSSDADAVIALVVGTPGWAASDIRVEKGDLEDLFLELTAHRRHATDQPSRHRSLLRRPFRKDRHS